MEMLYVQVETKTSAARCSLDVRSMNRIYTLITEEFGKKRRVYSLLSTAIIDCGSGHR